MTKMEEIKKALYQDCIDSKKLNIPINKWLQQAKSIINSLRGIGVKEPYKNCLINYCHFCALEIYGSEEYALL